MAARPIDGPRIGGADLAAPNWRRTKCRRGRIGGVEMAAYDLAAETIGGAEKTAPNWQSAEMAAQQKYNKRRKQKYTIKRLLACLLLASWVLGSAIKYEMLSDHLLVR